jgi:hypothetical protein
MMTGAGAFGADAPRTDGAAEGGFTLRNDLAFWAGDSSFCLFSGEQTNLGLAIS